MNILRNTRLVLTVALVMGALSAPVAAATTFEERFPSSADGPSLGTAPATESPTAEPSGGFDWGDASIGAAAVVAIMAIGTGVVLEVGRRRKPRPTVA